MAAARLAADSAAMTLLTALASAVGHRRPPPFHIDAAGETLDVGDEQAAACGWYDSSYDLSHGLEVVELDFDAFAAAP